MKLENTHLAKKAGTTSYLKVDWISFKKKRPPVNETIFIILRLRNGYYPVLGEYRKENISTIKYESIHFLSSLIPEIFFGTKDEKRLIAWGALDDVHV